MTGVVHRPYREARDQLLDAVPKGLRGLGCRVGTERGHGIPDHQWQDQTGGTASHGASCGRQRTALRIGVAGR
jgi:hypothetical protein